MSILNPTNLETCDYGTTNWNSIYSTNFQRLNSYLSKYQFLWDDNITKINGNDIVYYDGAWRLRKHNLEATAQPTVTDDASKGYYQGSIWIYNKFTYICVNPTSGSAEWKLVSINNNDKHSYTGNGTTTIEFDKYKNVYFTFGSQNETITLNTPVIEDTYYLFIQQDATGGRTIIWNTTIKWENKIEPILTTDANAIDLIIFEYKFTNWFGKIVNNFG